VQSIRDDALTSCPKCKSGDYRRVLHPPTIFDATPRTLGALADRNTSKLKGQREDLRGDVPEPYKPWWRDGEPNKGLANLTDAQKERYIMTGRTTEGLTPSITTGG